MVRKLGKRKLRNALLDPVFGKISEELKAPGELGRSMPGAVGAGAVVSPVKPAIPAFEGRTAIYTYNTKVSGESALLYQAEGWVRIRLMLETAGPVAVGTQDDVHPPLSGKGITLPVDVEIEFPLSKGNRIFISSTAINRVRVIIEPIPWAEQLTSLVGSLVSSLRRG